MLAHPYPYPHPYSLQAGGLPLHPPPFFPPFSPVGANKPSPSMEKTEQSSSSTSSSKASSPSGSPGGGSTPAEIRSLDSSPTCSKKDVGTRSSVSPPTAPPSGLMSTEAFLKPLPIRKLHTLQRPASRLRSFSAGAVLDSPSASTQEAAEMWPPSISETLEDAQVEKSGGRKRVKSGVLPPLLNGEEKPSVESTVDQDGSKSKKSKLETLDPNPNLPPTSFPNTAYPLQAPFPNPRLRTRTVTPHHPLLQRQRQLSVPACGVPGCTLPCAYGNLFGVGPTPPASPKIFWRAPGAYILPKPSSPPTSSSSTAAAAAAAATAAEKTPRSSPVTVGMYPPTFRFAPPHMGLCFSPMFAPPTAFSPRGQQFMDEDTVTDSFAGAFIHPPPRPFAQASSALAGGKLQRKPEEDATSNDTITDPNLGIQDEDEVEDEVFEGGEVEVLQVPNAEEEGDVVGALMALARG
ncbi:hypothetical protein HDV05_001167 [Chytridiales sp. JEL 0842]|nr:hypothetical protein HDV05_001167 [Chytridiales sp. JEL 0842]